MRIILRRLPDGTVAAERVNVRLQDRVRRFCFQAEVRKIARPSPARSFIDSLLGEKGRAIVARINPHFSKSKRPAAG